MTRSSSAVTDPDGIWTSAFLMKLWSATYPPNTNQHRGPVMVQMVFTSCYQSVHPDMTDDGQMAHHDFLLVSRTFPSSCQFCFLPRLNHSGVRREVKLPRGTLKRRLLRCCVHIYVSFILSTRRTQIWHERFRQRGNIWETKTKQTCSLGIKV